MKRRTFMFARSFYLSTFSAEVHLQGEKDEVNCKCCIKFSISVTGDQQLESGKKKNKKEIRAALEHLTSRKKPLWNSRSDRNSVVWNMPFLLHMKHRRMTGHFISVRVITFRYENQNWKFFSVNFEQLLVDKCMNSGITGKKSLVWELQRDLRLKTEGNGVLFP